MLTQIKIYKFILCFVFLAINIIGYCQSYINNVLGRYSVNISWSNGAINCSGILDLVPDSQYSNCVFYQDSCSVNQTWLSDPWDILVNADSTFVGYAPWTSANAALGKLYANDSIYLKIKVFGNNWQYRDFSGFKLYSTVGINDLNKPENELLISPQPARDVMYIQSTQVLFKEEDIPIMYDVSGKQIKLPVQYINASTYKLDVNSLNAGMYILEMLTENGCIRKKVILQK